MLSALILLRHLAPAGEAPAQAPPTDAQSRRAWALADFLQLYSPTELLSGPGCADTLAPLASRLDLRVTVADDLNAAVPGLTGTAHAAVWLAARALRTLPDSRRTTVVCAEGVVLAALLVAVAARDGHDLSAHESALDGAVDLPPGGGWVLHRDDGRLIDVKPLAAR